MIEAILEDVKLKKELFRKLDELAPAERDPGHQHLVDLDHGARRRHEAARPGHRDALHEPGAGDEAGRDHPRPRHLRRDLQRRSRS